MHILVHLAGLLPHVEIKRMQCVCVGTLLRHTLSSYCLIGLFRSPKNTFMANSESRGSPQVRLCYITVGSFFSRSQSDRKTWTAKVWMQTEQKLGE